MGYNTMEMWYAGSVCGQMIRSASISGYRGLQKLAIDHLGKVNLFVGKNNSGKTSVLEALYTLATSGDPAGLWNTILRRGEQLPFEPSPGRPMQPEIDVSHLFTGHELKEGIDFTIGTGNDHRDTIKCTVVKADIQENPGLFAHLVAANDVATIAPFALKFEGNKNKGGSLIPLTRRGGFRQDTFQLVMNLAYNKQKLTSPALQFVSTGSLAVSELISSWGDIVLTPDEDRVVSALQALDPKIERIATSSPSVFQQLSSRGGFIVKSSASTKPIPIGSFGDGTWRLLALAIGICRAKDGILFVDEIDTGLHYTATGSMWKLVYKAALDLNVQVFATTHSYDCVRSLASICDEKSSAQDEISIQRIEPESGRSIAYSSEQIKFAAAQDIEVR
jgi:hypothetical protein